MKAVISRRWMRAVWGCGRTCFSAALFLSAWVGVAANLSMEEVAGVPGARVIVRVTIDDAAGLAGGDFRLVLPDSVTLETPTLGLDAAGFLFASRVEAGQLSVAMARAEGLPAASAVLFAVPIRIDRDAPEGVHAFGWERVQLFDAAAAPLEVRLGGGQLTVLPPPEDQDGDGLPDAWEMEQFGHLGCSGAEDTDADGALNSAEFLAGTHPGLAGSVFRVEALWVRDQAGHRGLVLGWDGRLGRDYQVYWSPGPLGPGMRWQPVYRPVYQLNGTRYEWTDDGTRTPRVLSGETERYYQVRDETP